VSRWEIRQLAQTCRYAGCRRVAEVELGRAGENTDESAWEPAGAYCQAHGTDMLRMRQRTTQSQPAVEPPERKERP